MSTTPNDPENVLLRLEWTVIRRLDGLLQGDYRTLLRGAGVDLADLREYQLHDDVRHIDWNVTARLQVPYLKVALLDRHLFSQRHHPARRLLDEMAQAGLAIRAAVVPEKHDGHAFVGLERIKAAHQQQADGRRGNSGDHAHGRVRILRHDGRPGDEQQQPDHLYEYRPSFLGFRLINSFARYSPMHLQY